MSDVNLYLDDAQAANEIVTMNVNITMTDLTIYLPLSWQVKATWHLLSCQVILKLMVRLTVVDQL